MEKDVNTQEKDDMMVQTAFQQLLDSYLASPHRKKVDIITKAFNFARKAHEGVRRLSGEPYIMHPLAVAQIVCSEIGLGSTSICAALLHDVVEDTDWTVEDLENVFGPKIAQIVDGLTKISGGIFGDKASAQAESFRKLLLTMSDDIRVILIKISDRLHNMRTLGSQPQHKQYKIAGETLYIYAPLAYRLGLNRVKEELEELGFRYEQPEEHDRICQQIEAIRPQLETDYEQFIIPIRKELDALGFHYDIKARIKRPYSVWMKMQNKHVKFDEIYDLLAVRIVFDPRLPKTRKVEGKDVALDDATVQKIEKSDCRHIYSVCTSIYRPHPARTRDWLDYPKSNGYQALHTTLMKKEEREDRKGRWIELQIRSRRMDDMAERGFAAHWKYKEGAKDDEAKETELDKWLQTIKEILDDPQPSAMDFLSTIKLNLYASEILVITPKGEFKTMPADCTVLDFAFSIHTFLGTHCMGAKVNHELVPVDYKLKSGDQVEILTSSTLRVQPEWVSFTTTAKARNKVEAVLRRMKRERQKKGEELMEEWCAKHEMEMTSQLVENLGIIHQHSSREELFAQIGAGTIVLDDNDIAELQRLKRNKKGRRDWKKYIPFLKKYKKTEDTTETPTEEIKIDRKKPVILNEENMSRYTMCTHCHPIPGDQVLGYLDNQNRIIIHKLKCPIADKLKSSDGNHILSAKWDTHKLLDFSAMIHIEGFDRVGIIKSLADVITQQLNVNVHRLSIEANHDLFQGDIELSVHDTEDVETIIKNLKKIAGVEEVTRVS